MPNPYFLPKRVHFFKVYPNKIFEMNATASEMNILVYEMNSLTSEINTKLYELNS